LRGITVKIPQYAEVCLFCFAHVINFLDSAVSNRARNQPVPRSEFSKATAMPTSNPKA
jgi:hypothetical protein